MTLPNLSGFNYLQLSGDIAATLKQKEIAMKEIINKAYTDLGRELKHAQDILSKNGYGCFREWTDSIGLKKDTVNRLIQRYELIVAACDHQADLLEDLPVSLTYEIARPSAESTEPKRQAKQAVLDGEVKTLKEYRELLAEKEAAEARLCEAESHRERAEKEAELLRDKLERVEESEPETVTEYIEVETTDPKIVAENERYKELFGDISMYEGRTTRVTNGDAITYTVYEFSEDVRKFVEKYGHLTHFVQEFNGMISEGKQEYKKAIHAMQTLMRSIDRSIDEEGSIIING